MPAKKSSPKTKRLTAHEKNLVTLRNLRKSLKEQIQKSEAEEQRHVNEVLRLEQTISTLTKGLPYVDEVKALLKKKCEAYEELNRLLEKSANGSEGALKHSREKCDSLEASIETYRKDRDTSNRSLVKFASDLNLAKQKTEDLEALLRALRNDLQFSVRASRSLYDRALEDLKSK